MTEKNPSQPTVRKDVLLHLGEHFKTVLSIAFILLSDLLYPWSTKLSDKCGEIGYKIDPSSTQSSIYLKSDLKK